MTSTTSTNSSTATAGIVASLGAGSGIDIQALARNLVDAERAPRKEVIDGRIAKTEAQISGYGAMKYSLSSLKTAFEALNDASDFKSLSVSNSQPTAFGVTTTATASARSYNLQVSQIAKGETRVASFSSSQQFNSGSSFWVNLSVAGEALDPISVGTDSPAGIVYAINSANLGVTAQLIETDSDSGGNVSIVLTGPEGEDNTITFSASTDAAGTSTIGALSNTGVWTQEQAPANAVIVLNGVTIERDSNAFSDVISGATINLYSATTGTARLQLQRETSGIQSKMEALVAAYNELQDSFDVLNDPDSEVETFGGALANDSLLRSIRSQIRSIFITESSTPGTDIQYARHVGLSLQRDGRLKLDTDKLESALQDNFDDTVTMFTAGRSNNSVYGSIDSGLAGDAVKTIDKMLRSTGVIASQVQTATDKVDQYEEQLAKLETRMEQLLERYLKQFAAMDDIVSQSAKTRERLSSSFIDWRD